MLEFQVENAVDWMVFIQPFSLGQQKLKIGRKIADFAETRLQAQRRKKENERKKTKMLRARKYGTYVRA